MPKQQKGYVWREGDLWLLRYRDTLVENGELKRKQLTHNLGAVRAEHQRLKNPPQCVLQDAALFLSRINQVKDPRKNLALAEFVQTKFFPHIEPRRNPSTVHTHRVYWNRHFRPRCGNVMVRDFSTPDAQQVLDAIAREYPELKRQTLFRLKSLLSAILRLAVSQGYHPGNVNPVREVEVPDAPDGEETIAYDLGSVMQMLNMLPEPARTAVAVAAFAGLRRGEIEGLVWEAYTGEELKVLSSVWNGHVGDPKTRKSKAPIPVIASLRSILDEHRARCGNPVSGPIFKTRNRTLMALNNLLNDQILPVLERCEYCRETRPKHDAATDHEYKRDSSLPQWGGWHGFRRGLATNLNALGVSDLTIQRILRHSDVSTTRRAYIKTLPQQTVDAMALFQATVSKSATVQ